MNKNIILIGMPGCGKTTLAQLLSEKLQIPSVDLDKEIERYSNQTIPSLFEKGELHFRDIESEVTAIFSKRVPLIIATGGGIVLRKENMDALRENGVVIFLNRSLENIASDVELSSRPLLKDGLDKLQKLYDERIALYRNYADFIIDNNESPKIAIEEMMKQLGKRNKKGQRI